MSILYFLIMGIIVGFLARLLVPGRQRIGILLTILLGGVGAVVGGVIASALNTGEVGDMDLLGFIFALVTAAVLVAGAEAIGIGAPKDRERLGRGRD